LLWAGSGCLGRDGRSEITLEITTMAMTMASTAVVAIAMMKLEPSDTVTGGRNPSCVLARGSVFLPGTARVVNNSSIY
jgi:hypothetical protein